MIVGLHMTSSTQRDEVLGRIVTGEPEGNEVMHVQFSAVLVASLSTSTTARAIEKDPSATPTAIALPAKEGRVVVADIALA